MESARKLQRMGWRDTWKGKLRYAAMGIRAFLDDENAVGVIEVVLILVVLIGLVAIFKTQINELLTKIFDSIDSLSNDIL